MRFTSALPGYSALVGRRGDAGIHRIIIIGAVENKRETTTAENQIGENTET